MSIEKVIFNDPATIIKWGDGTKTVVKVQPGDTYDPEKGMLAAIAKRAYGNDNTFNKVMKKWLPQQCKVEEKPELGTSDVFHVGDQVVYDGCGRDDCPEWYPPAGTVGEIIGINTLAENACVQ